MTEPVNLDADLRNADWLRTSTWDLPTDPAQLPIDDPVLMLQRPSAEAMPKNIRRYLNRLIADAAIQKYVVEKKSRGAGKGKVGDYVGHPFRGNQWSRSHEIDVEGGTMWERMPKSQRDAIDAHLAAYGETRESMQKRADDMMDRAFMSGGKYHGEPSIATEAGRDWYGREGRIAKARAKALDVDEDTYLGVVAAVSPRRLWENEDGDKHPNMDIADAMVKFHQSKQRILITQEMADNYAAHHKGDQKLHALVGQKKRLSDLDPEVEAGIMCSKQFLNVQDSAAVKQGLQILRGEGKGRTAHERVASVLTGNKRRSFYNNLRNEGDGESITIDGHMVNGLMGSNIKVSNFLMNPSHKPGATRKNPDWLGNAGSYPAFTVVVSNARKRWNTMHPDDPISNQDAQAIIWTVFKNDGGARKLKRRYDKAPKEG